ncbi:hypothetical protein ABK040_014568 [Willaertia magna]
MNCVKNWTTKEVCKYINEIPSCHFIDMSIVAALFEYHCLTGMDLLELNSSDVKEMLMTDIKLIVNVNVNTTVNNIQKKERRRRRVNVKKYVKTIILRKHNLTIDSYLKCNGY